MSEHLNEYGCIRTIQPEAIWFQITCELTCHIVVALLLPQQKSVSQV